MLAGGEFMEVLCLCCSIIDLLWIKYAIRLCVCYLSFFHDNIFCLHYQSVRFHVKSWLPARSIVLECLLSRGTIDPSAEIMVLDRFCPVRCWPFFIQTESYWHPPLNLMVCCVLVSYPRCHKRYAYLFVLSIISQCSVACTLSHSIFLFFWLTFKILFTYKLTYGECAIRQLVQVPASHLHWLQSCNLMVNLVIFNLQSCFKNCFALVIVCYFEI
jgi:hypothetical protein